MNYRVGVTSSDLIKFTFTVYLFFYMPVTVNENFSSVHNLFRHYNSDVKSIEMSHGNIIVPHITVKKVNNVQLEKMININCKLKHDMDYDMYICT